MERLGIRTDSLDGKCRSREGRTRDYYERVNVPCGVGSGHDGSLPSVSGLDGVIAVGRTLRSRNGESGGEDGRSVLPQVHGEVGTSRTGSEGDDEGIQSTATRTDKAVDGRRERGSAL